MSAKATITINAHEITFSSGKTEAVTIFASYGERRSIFAAETRSMEQEAGQVTPFEFSHSSRKYNSAEEVRVMTKAIEEVVDYANMVNLAQKNGGHTAIQAVELLKKIEAELGGTTVITASRTSYGLKV
jgi:hypothetical protein